MLKLLHFTFFIIVELTYPAEMSLVPSSNKINYLCPVKKNNNKTPQQ